MISLVKIVTEAYKFDADDYIPVEGLEVGMIVRDKDDNRFEIVDFSDGNKLVVRLEDDPRDVRGMIYDEDCVAHESDNVDRRNGYEGSLDDDDLENDLYEAEENEDNSPESIVGRYNKVIASGEGFDISEIEDGLRTSLEMQREKGKNYFKTAWVDVKNAPAENAVGIIKFNDTGKYKMQSSYSRDMEEKSCYTIEEAAQQVEKRLKTGANPKELVNHIIGWMMTVSDFRPALYPMLDEEGVKIYKAAEKELSDEMSRFYGGSGNWTGD